PECQSRDLICLTTRRLWKCKASHARQQFSVKVGTIFEDSPIALEKWFAAIWMVANAAEGVSSHELARALEVTQKTAWFMLHRIQLAVSAGSFMRPGSGGAAPAGSGVMIFPDLSHRNANE